MLRVNFYRYFIQMSIILGVLSLISRKNNPRGKYILEKWLPNDTLYIFDAKFGYMWGLFPKYVVTEPALSPRADT